MWNSRPPGSHLMNCSRAQVLNCDQQYPLMQVRPSLDFHLQANRHISEKQILEAESTKNSRRLFLFMLIPAMSFAQIRPSEAAEKKKAKALYDEEVLLEQNRRMQKMNKAPPDFPGFVREGFEVRVLIGQNYVTEDSGLMYLDIKEGNGDPPKPGQQVIFHYSGYNESGRRVDSSYLQGAPAKTRIGIKGMIPGFELGLQSMKPGGIRRIIIPPELGPPVGPSTFFSAKQFEVFDIELLEVKDCTRRTIAFYSDVVCE